MFTDVSYTFENVSSRQVVYLEFEYETLAGLEIKVLGEVIVTTSEDILHQRSITDDFCIALHIHRNGLTSAVEDGENGLAFVLTGDDIDAVVRDKLCL